MTNNRIVIIQGSSRSMGDTFTVSNYLVDKGQCDFIDLKELNIGAFDYDFINENDDFLPTITSVIQNYTVIIFATPVYWYTMSGVMKTFLDRISDLLKIHKDLGRLLRNKSMALLSCSNADDLPEGFQMPFKESAKYLGMQYLGDCHAWVNQGEIEEKVLKKLDDFYQLIEGSLAKV